MKKLFRTLFLIGLMVLLMVPYVFSAGAKEAKPAAKKLRIGFAAHSIELGALFGQLREGMLQELREKGVDFELFQGAPDTSGNHEAMLRILENMATMGLDYVVVGPTSLDLNEPGLVAIAKSGAKLVMTDYQPPKNRTVPYNDAVLTWVVYSHEEMGYKAGSWMMQDFRKRGIMNPRVVILWGPAASEISQQRGEGVKKAMFEHKDMKPVIVYEAHADFKRDLAYTETERAIAAYDFDAIVGLNSYMAVSAMEALKANGKLNKVSVIGMGGIVDELQAIALGQIKCAPFRDPRSMGRKAATAIILHRDGREKEIVRMSYSEMPQLDSVEAIRKYVPKEMFDVDKFLATKR